MKLTPINIKTQEFTKSLRGYDADEVKAFLEKLAAEVEDLMNENETLIDEIEELKTRLDEYKKIEKDLQTTLLNAQNSSTKSFEVTKKQTSMMLKEAELKAARIIEKAKENANEIRNAVINLREEKDLIISKLKAIVNTQSTLLEGKVKKIDEVQQELEKTKQQQPKDDLDVDVDDIVNKLL
ncbi:MAG: DivIVA domain-containing protein [Bacteroidetes bacterium]|nr:DivIVA domain-containing protein [Bacteroidota bacterium]